MEERRVMKPKRRRKNEKKKERSKHKPGRIYVRGSQKKEEG
jgi:hypothetical protein